MAPREYDPYEEAQLNALREEFGAKGRIDDPMKFYIPQNLYYYDDDLYKDDLDLFEGESPNAPADLTDIPTSTLNVSRPRTVAAGYDKNRGVLTVVFRDGTIWNYQNVTEGQWQNFQASISKGRPWINEQKFGKGEPADMSNLDPRVQAGLYAAARQAQLQYKTVRQYRGPSGKANISRLGKTGVVKAQRSLRARTPKRGGKPPKNN
jgi:hypothetical protein